MAARGIKMGENTNLHDEKLIEIEFANIFQDAVRNSPILKYKEASLKEEILQAKPDQLLVVLSTINSPKEIQSVDYYDEEFLRKTL